MEFWLGNILPLPILRPKVYKQKNNMETLIIT